ncbi:MAG: glycosyl transferase [Betaproteobacteria bacterium]|nr:glycosyl transferase [Betaproteobacteria bacterium]
MIPKKLHLCWLSGEPFPPLIQHCLDSWKKYLPDYEVVVWDLQRIDLKEIPWAREAFEHRKYAFAADYIRLYALYEMGGIYLDADVEVTRSFDDLLNQGSFMGYESSGDLEPAVIGAHPGMQWIRKCLERYKDRHFVKIDGSLDMQPLPYVIRERLTLSHSLPDKAVSQPTLVESANLTLYPAEFFSPKNAYTKRIARTSATRAIHHFDGHWVEQTVKQKLKNGAHRTLGIFGEEVHRKAIQIIRVLKS